MKRLMTRSNAHIFVSWVTQRYPQEVMDWIFLNPTEFLLRNNILFSQSGQPREGKVRKS